MTVFDDAAEHLTRALTTPDARVRERSFTTGWTIAREKVTAVAGKVTRNHQLAEEATSLAAERLWLAVIEPSPSIKTAQRIGPGLIRNIAHFAGVDILNPAVQDREHCDHLIDYDPPDHGPDTVDELAATEATLRMAQRLEQLAQRAETEYRRPLWAAIIRRLAAGDRTFAQVQRNLGRPHGTIARNVKELRESGLLEAPASGFQQLRQDFTAGVVRAEHHQPRRRNQLAATARAAIRTGRPDDLTTQLDLFT